MIRSSSASFFVACSLASIGCGSAAATPPVSTGSDRRAPSSDAPAETALAKAATALAGRWRCSGAIHGPDGAPSPSLVSLDVELDLGQAWLRTEFVALSGAHEYDFTSYRTFRHAHDQWTNVIVDNFGGHAVSRSNDGVTWTGVSSSPMGELQIQDVERLEASGELKLIGQYSLDGKSWRTGYALTCRK